VSDDFAGGLCSVSALDPGRVWAAPRAEHPMPKPPSSFLLPRHVFASPMVEALCQTAPRLLLCLDYDGTLVPIAPRPEKARPTPTLCTLLAQLARTPSVEVAVVSGRPLTDLCSLLPVPGLTYVGTHGLEIRTATGEVHSLMSAGAFTMVMARLRHDLEVMISGRSGLLLEDKRHALALHYRLAGQEDGEHAVGQFVAAVRAYQRRGLAVEVLHGKKVVEVRPIGVNKGKAVQSLLGHRDNTVLPLYLGDDVTDEDAFRVLSSHGVRILVADPPRRTAAQYYLKDSAEVSSFLFRLLSLR